VAPQVKESVLNAAEITQRCHLRNSEIGLQRYIRSELGHKKAPATRTGARWWGTHETYRSCIHKQDQEALHLAPKTKQWHPLLNRAPDVAAAQDSANPDRQPSMQTEPGATDAKTNRQER